MHFIRSYEIIVTGPIFQEQAIGLEFWKDER